MNLYQMTAQSRSALSELEEMGMDAQTISDTMEGLEGEIHEKSKNVAAYFLGLDSEIRQLKEVEDKIKARRVSKEKHSKRLKDYLRENMIANEIRKIECPEFKITIRKAVASVEVIDQDLINSEYIKTKVTESVDKTAIKAALKAGMNVTGAKLTHSNPSLAIK